MWSRVEYVVADPLKLITVYSCNRSCRHGAPQLIVASRFWFSSSPALQTLKMPPAVAGKTPTTTNSTWLHISENQFNSVGLLLYLDRTWVNLCMSTSETDALGMITSCLLSVFRAICKTINYSKVHGCIRVTVHRGLYLREPLVHACTHALAFYLSRTKRRLFISTSIPILAACY